MRRRLVFALLLFAATWFAAAAPALAFGRTGCFQAPAARRPAPTIMNELNSALMQRFPAETRACILYARGLLYQLQGEDARAITDFSAAIRWMNSYADAYAARADAYENTGDHVSADRDYAQAQQFGEGPPGQLTERCWIRALRGKPLDRALTDCNRSLKQEPDDFNALASRALVYLRLGNSAAAIADCDAALKIMPKNTTALFIRALAKLRSGDTPGGNADLAAAKAQSSQVEETFAIYGVKP